MKIANQPTQPEWYALYEAAAKFKKLGCWEWMDDDDLFGVQNPETGEFGYCCIMGKLGENFALAVYLGSEGLQCLFDMLSGKLPYSDALFAQKCLMASFEDRDYLAPEDLKVIKGLGLKFRGKNNWPFFRSFSPGLFPWFISADECRFLTIALQQAADVALRCKQNKKILDSDDPDQFLVRLAAVKDDSFTWRDEYLVPTPFEIKPLFFAADDLKVKKVKALKPKMVDAWELDTFFLPTPVGEKGRPYYPKVCLCLDHNYGLILSFHMVQDFREQGHEFHDMLLRTIEDSGKMPKKLLVANDETLLLFKDLADKLGVKLVINEHLKHVEEAKYSLIEFME